MSDNHSNSDDAGNIDQQRIAESEALVGGLLIGAVSGVVDVTLAVLMVVSGIGIMFSVKYRNRKLQAGIGQSEGDQ